MNDRVSELKLFFPTPIWITNIKNYQDTNKIMLEYITNIKKNDEIGVQRSNLKGWHSPDFNLNQNEPKKFVNMISKSISEFLVDMGWDIKKQQVKITAMWSIVNPPGSSNQRHIHGNNFISAAYYAKVHKNSGNIIFHDPRSEPVFYHPIVDKPNNLNTNVVSIEPQEGMLVLFPSYLHHSVDINQSEEDRIIISFNATLI